MSEESPYAKAVSEWWNSFPARSRSRGNIAGGLVIIENMRSDFSLEIESHKAERSDQLRNASAPRALRFWRGSARIGFCSKRAGEPIAG